MMNMLIIDTALTFRNYLVTSHTFVFFSSPLFTGIPGI
jgi:hypothetical protein